MKKKLLLILSICGVCLSVLGGIYLHRSNSLSLNFDQTGSNEIEETLQGPKPDSPDLAMNWRLLAWKDQTGRFRLTRSRAPLRRETQIYSSN